MSCAVKQSSGGSDVREVSRSRCLEEVSIQRGSELSGEDVESSERTVKSSDLE